MLALLAVAVFGTYLFLSLALRNRRVWLPVGIVFNLALLAFFKYKLLFLDPASPSLVDFAPLEFLLVERYARGDSEPLFFRPIRARSPPMSSGVTLR